MQATMLDTQTDLTVLEVQRSALIRAEVLAGEQRERLESAVRQFIRGGMDIDSVSEASGLTPDEIRRILAR